MKNNRFKEWTKQKGFYTILLLFVITVVGTSAVITNRNLKKIRNQKESQEYVDLDAEFGDFDLMTVDDIGSEEERLTVTEEEAANIQVATDEGEEEKEITEEEEENEEENKEAVAENEKEGKLDFVVEVAENPEPTKTVEVVQEEVISDKEIALTEEELEIEEVFYPYESGDMMQWPVEGEILMTFSPLEPIYDKTLEQFRTNSSVSIAGPPTTQVRAAASGIVESITKDPQTGVTVVLNHGNGWKTTYGQLQEKVLVKEQERVNKGRVIGGIGEPSKYAVLLGEHLYFQVTKNGEPIDPSYVLPE